MKNTPFSGDGDTSATSWLTSVTGFPTPGADRIQKTIPKLTNAVSEGDRDGFPAREYFGGLRVDW